MQPWSRLSGFRRQDKAPPNGGAFAFACGGEVVIRGRAKDHL